MRNHLIDCKEDIKDIQHTIKLKTGVSITAEEACNILEEYSDVYAAGWLSLSETPDGIWEDLSILDLTKYIGWTSLDIKYER